jgi:hypothetical protein
MKNKIVKCSVVALGFAILVPLAAQGQDFQRVSFGADVTAWFVPDLDGFAMALASNGTVETHAIDDSVLYGFRPFVRLGLLRQFDLQLSHEFAFGDDAEPMVSAASGIWRPFSRSGLELHASICYGQFDWDGPGAFKSSWGWEIGAGYNLALLESVSLLFGVAYRDITMDFKVDKFLRELGETRPDITTVSFSETQVDTAGVVASAGVLITF